ncbi:hypothetical protein L1277_001457 [Okibacterium sp. HSC-33S16]|uniref:RICIN domain-containing protein n=1 Tax=Okibacterium sp. HSC-33S16 TaxID=2910965 RepID=UPI0020A15901|nr:RICIN domain-containing protein [Okibacterium sp. HSC-33S16]MCP2031366.1 hypothetical protein [Okibacterium sp. HSC-33S16]
MSAPVGYYQVRNTKSGLCINAGGTTNFAPLTQQDCLSQAPLSQSWTFTSTNPAGYFAVAPKVTPTVVWDVEGVAGSNAARVILYQPNQGTNQQFSVVAVAENKYQFVARNSGKCLSVIQGVAPTAATHYEQQICDAMNDAQTFSLIFVDTTAPDVPTSLTAKNTTQTSTQLSWSGSTDDVGVVGYDVFRDGTLIKTVATLSFSDALLSAGTSYKYEVAARDKAGNVSARSQAVTVTTLSPPIAAMSCANYNGNYVQYSWNSPVAGDPNTSGYAVYLNGSTVATTTTASTGWPQVQLYPYSVATSVTGSVPVIVKQIRLDGTEKAIGAGTMVISSGPNGRTVACGRL